MQNFLQSTLIAKIDEAGAITVGDYRELFPDVTFDIGGPDEQWLADNNCKPVIIFKDYNPSTHKLVPAEPFVEGDAVCVVTIESLSRQELDANQGEVAQALQAVIVAQTQARLDAFAQTRNYDGILSACTYATSPTAKFADEGQYCVEARDATWAKLYEMLGEVQAGARPMPTSFADVEPELPALQWPA